MHDNMKDIYVFMAKGKFTTYNSISYHYIFNKYKAWTKKLKFPT